MKHSTRKSLSILVIGLLLCFSTLSIAGHKLGHSGGGGKPGGGNQGEEGTADFFFDLEGFLTGSFTDDVGDTGFEILEGQLAGESESITVSGDAGIALISVDNDCTGEPPLPASLNLPRAWVSCLRALWSLMMILSSFQPLPAQPGPSVSIMTKHPPTGCSLG